MYTKQSSTQKHHQNPSHNMHDKLPYDSIKTDNPLYQVAQYYKGRALAKLSSFEDVINSYDQVQENHNFYGAAQFYKAQCLYNKNEFHAAKDTLSNISKYEIFFPNVLELIRICEHNIQSLELYDQFESIINMQEIQNNNKFSPSESGVSLGRLGETSTEYHDIAYI